MLGDFDRGRLDYLDAIRGLAALAVVVHHYCTAYGYPYSDTLLTKSPMNVWRDGPAAVSLFFVLSGFVLSLRFFGEHAQNLHPLEWLVARVARIWLPFISVLLISAILHQVGVPAFQTIPPRQAAILRAGWAEPLNVVDVLKQSNLISGHWQKLVPQAWTLQVELVMSLLVPPAAMLVNRRTSWLLLVVFLLIVGLHAPLYLAHFSAGIMLARSVRSFQTKVPPIRHLALAIGVVGLCLYSARTWLPGNTYDSAPSTLGWYVNGIGATCILLCALTSSRFQAILSHSALVWLGRVSYSVYLWHWAILVCVAPFVLRVADSRLSTKPILCWWLGLFGTVATVLAVSAISFRLVEVPSVSFGRVVRRKLGQR